MHEIVKGAQHLLKRRLRIDMMDIVDVDIVGLESFKAGFNRVHNMDTRHAGIVGSGAHRVEYFGRHNLLMATALQGFTEDCFRLTTAIAIGAVKEIDASIQRQVDD